MKHSFWDDIVDEVQVQPSCPKLSVHNSKQLHITPLQFLWSEDAENRTQLATELRNTPLDQDEL
jgi:hypothetical protein